jgi:hypothetical protein
VLDAMVRMHLAIHACRETRLRALRARLAARIDTVDGLPDDQRDRLRRRLAALPDGDRLCHGDFHPLNLVGPVDAPVIVDWLDASSGPPPADACRSYLLLSLVRPDLAEGYLGRYCAAGGIAATTVLDWLPVLAAARLGEGVGPEEQSTLLRLAATA